MARNEVQEINAGSMADIAFLLLIFFLVTTTMSTNTGMQRKLPPPPDNEKVDVDVDVKERNVMVVMINMDNNIAIKGKPILLKNICENTKKFFLNSNNSEDLPEKKEEDVPFFGKVKVSQGVVSLQTDRNTNYEKYLQVQNELVRAVNELREELSMRKFGIPFEELSEEKQKAVGKVFPLNISEAEPRQMIKK